jgi:hypothetical protein
MVASALLCVARWLDSWIGVFGNLAIAAILSPFKAAWLVDMKTPRRMRFVPSD